MREDSLCPIFGNAGEGVRGCSQATIVHCNSCGYEWECLDTGTANQPLYICAGHCESCGSSGVSLNRCEDCPVPDLHIARATSHAGRLLNRVLDLDFAFEHRINIGSLPVTVEEFEGLKILAQERSKKQMEDAKSEQEKMLANRAVAEARQRDRQRGF